MAKTGQEFLDHLTAGGLVPPEVIENLRRQVAKAAKPVAAGTVARLLVDRGHLTAAQGERLIGGPLPPAKEAKPAAAAAKTSASSSSILGLEPIGPDPVVKPVAKAVPSAKPTATSQSDV